MSFGEITRVSAPAEKEKRRKSTQKKQKGGSVHFSPPPPPLHSFILLSRTLSIKPGGKQKTKTRGLNRSEDHRRLFDSASKIQ